MAKQQTGTAAASGSGGAVYGLGLIGAEVWYWQQADGLWQHVGGLLQGIVWPAFLVYDALKALHG